MSQGDLVHAREYAASSAELRDIADILLRQGHEDDALAALAEAAERDPADTEARARLARAYITRGEMGRARVFLTREVAGADPELLWTLAEIDLRGGRSEEGMARCGTRSGPTRRAGIISSPSAARWPGPTSTPVSSASSWR